MGFGGWFSNANAILVSFSASLTVLPRVSVSIRTGASTAPDGAQKKAGALGSGGGEGGLKRTCDAVPA